jgi:hypothetical protein
MGWFFVIFGVLAAAFAIWALSKFAGLSDRPLPENLRADAGRAGPSYSFIGGVRWKGGGSP